MYFHSSGKIRVIVLFCNEGRGLFLHPTSFAKHTILVCLLTIYLYTLDFSLCICSPFIFFSLGAEILLFNDLTDKNQE